MLDRVSLLLVEDNPRQRAMAQSILELNGRLSVTAAENGAEGLELALAIEPQVILLDLILPGISGLELLRRYRAQGGKARVLVLTQAAGPWVCDAAMAAGADFLFSKPVRWGEVLRLISLLPDSLTLRCRDLLAALGAPARQAGFSQAALAAGLLASGRCKMMKEVYIEVARREQVSPAGVEINIRRLLSAVYKKDLPPNPWPIPLPAGNPPSNQDFLRTLAQAATFPL